ncbi:MAG: rane protein [Labilithrix sp.]|nr:rane protein [Labilithrix sp.]
MTAGGGRAVACWALGALLSLAGEGAAKAQSTAPAALSPYERESIDDALALVGGAIDPAPEGKILEDVDVVPLDVIEGRDPAPRFLNHFHWTTRAAVIRREVLLGVGEPYRQYLVDETVRVLRLFRQLSLVVIVPTKGSQPNTVRLLVVTKDTWSLRTQLDIGLGKNGLDMLKLEPSERNLFGTLDSAFARLELFPETVTLGVGVYIPRLARRRIYFSAEGNVVVNRTSGDPEGTYGQALAWSPQVTARQQWLWGVSAKWRNEIVRRYVGARVAAFDAPSTPEMEHIPDAYRARRFTEGAQLTRSFGLAHKADVTFGAEVNVREYVGLDPTRIDPRVVDDHRRLRVPTSDTRAGPWAQVRVYENRFFRAYDLDTLGLAEDYRLGYDAWVRAYPITRLLGSTRDFVGVDAVAQYVVQLADGMARLTGEGLLEASSSELASASYAANGAFYSPRFVLGRLVIDALAIVRPENYSNLRAAVGGESRLRGQPSAALLGANLLAYNMELRSRPLHILASQLGGALFFDVADAFDAWPAQPRSSVGVGLRAVLPQLDRQVVRFDLGFPIVRAEGAGPVGFYLALEQAFPEKTPDPPNGLILPVNAGQLGQ